MDWKVFGIVFFVLFIVETIAVIGLIYVGYTEIETENAEEYECAYNVCGDYSSYGYDEYQSLCYCYVGDEIVVEKYVGN